MALAEVAGKFVDVQKARKGGGEYIEDEDEGQSLEIYLSAHNRGDFGDEMGFNAYSLMLILDETKIADYKRIGHCHMCGGQGSGEELERFPSTALEEESERLLNEIVTTKSVARRQLSRFRSEKKRKAKTSPKMSAAEKAARREPKTSIGSLRTAIILGKSAGENGSASLVEKCKGERLGDETLFREGLLSGYEKALILFRGRGIYVPELLLSNYAFEVGLETLRKKSPGFTIPIRGNLVCAALTNSYDRLGETFRNLYVATFEKYGYSTEKVEININDSVERNVSSLRKFPNNIMVFCFGLSMDGVIAYSFIEKLRIVGVQNAFLVHGMKITAKDISKRQDVYYLPDPLTGVKIVERIIRDR